MAKPGRPFLVAWFICWAGLVLVGCGSDDGGDSGDTTQTGGRGAGGDTGQTGSGGSGADTGQTGSGGSGEAGQPTTSGQLAINELMPSNRTTIVDEGGAYADWVEIYNSSAEDLDLGGYWVSDTFEQPLRTQLAQGLIVPAGGVLLLWVDSDIVQGDSHLPFNLDREGEAFLLSDPDGALLDSVEWPIIANSDESYARFPDGTGAFVWCTFPTPQELNGPSCGG
jgi:hypothetical protein